MARASRLLVVTLIALAVRTVTLHSTVDVPGDGPSRAMLAYEWSRAPDWASAGAWPPGFMYLAGTFAWVVPDPLTSSRILNVILGTLTVPALYSVVAIVFGPVAALWSAVAVAIFPLHVGLSASSLTEVSFLFEMITGLTLLLWAPRAPRFRVAAGVAAALCFILAEMTRYEAWALVPLAPLYVYLRTRNRLATSALLVAISVFPIVWTSANVHYLGDPFAGLSAATNATALGEQRVGLLQALSLLGDAVVAHTGWVLLAAIVAGALLQLRDAVRARLTVEQLVYLGMTALYWMVMLYFSMVRGTTLYNRYLLFGFVASLPFAALPFVGWRRPDGGWPPRRAARAVVLIVVSVAMLAGLRVAHGAWPSLSMAHPRYSAITLWVTRERPVAIEHLVEWLAGERFAATPIIATEMGWVSTYVPLYHSEVTGRFFIVSDWMDDPTVRMFLLARRPALLLTRVGDERFTQRIEHILNTAIGAERVVYDADGLRAYELDVEVYARRKTAP